ncbi:MAG: DUF6056 family protein [Anaerolineaceae bacterium]|nr:DUF6056 family protein [Anaerolineaceae bacterium]
MKQNKIFLCLILILLAISLFAMVFPAFQARWMADDYCMNADAKEVNITSFFQSIYTSWSGRFAYIIATYFLSSLPAQTLGFQVSMIVMLWLLALSFAMNRGAALIQIQFNWQECFILAMVVLLCLFKISPNLYQNLFWRDGIINYVLPLVFSTFSLGLLAQVLKSGMTVALGFALWFSAFLSAGFSESAGIAHLSLFASIWLFTAFSQDKNRARILGPISVILGGTLAGFLIEFLAPGNAIRGGILPDKPGFIELVLLTLRNIAHLYGKLIYFGIFWVLIALAVGTYFSYFSLSKSQAEQEKSQKIFGWAIRAFTVNFLLGSGVCAAIAYLMKAYPDDRIIFIPYFFAILSICAAGLVIGRHFGSVILQRKVRNQARILNLVQLVFSFIFLFIAIGSIVQLIKTLPAQLDYARRWDERDLSIQNEITLQRKDLIIPGLESRYGLPDLQLEKDDWVNRCMASYYGANSITGK